MIEVEAEWIRRLDRTMMAVFGEASAVAVTAAFTSCSTFKASAGGQEKTARAGGLPERRRSRSWRGPFVFENLLLPCTTIHLSTKYLKINNQKYV